MGEIHTKFFVTKPGVKIPITRHKWKHDIEMYV